jgi:hypothetical protein
MDGEPVFCPSCNVPMTARGVTLRPLGRRRERDAAPPDVPMRITSWQCWGCGRVRPATGSDGAQAA